MKKANVKGFVQGDVIGHIVASIPADAKPSQNRVLAYGEATGHHHVVEGNVTAFETATDFYFQVPPEAPATVRHIGDEHEAIEIAPGLIFRVPKVSQVEYDGAEERRVLD